MFLFISKQIPQFQKNTEKFQRFESNKYGDKTNEPRRDVDELFIFAIRHNSNGWICIVLSKPR